MNSFDEQDLHRLVKQALDSGLAGSLEEAHALFASYCIVLDIDADAAMQTAYQIALLTCVALARRVFLGGVYVALDQTTELAVPLPFHSKTLAEAVRELGGTVVSTEVESPTRRPRITFSSKAGTRMAAFHVRPSFGGWRGGVVPIESEMQQAGEVMALAPMLAAGLAINEAYSFVSGGDLAAGRRSLGLSLWQPASDWLLPDDAPRLELLPSQLWLLGLGHLGQAYLWALGILPYPDRSLSLVLQDIDVISRSTESTSVLTDRTLVGTRKTRAMASWAERRGFVTAIHERTFDAGFRRQDDEPPIALCGVDNAKARRAFDQAGFSLVVEAGLGHGHRDFQTIRLHTLPGAKSAAEIWSSAATSEDLSNRPAYQKLLQRGDLDQCGVTLLAGKAVGAPFVGAVAATLVVAEVLRLLHGGTLTAVLDLDLRSLEHRVLVPQRIDFSSLNPGFVSCGELRRDAGPSSQVDDKRRG